MYNVIFEYTEGCLKGCRTWTPFASRNRFVEFWKDFESKSHEKIVEEGISDKRAKELIDEVPMEHVALAMMKRDIAELVEGIKTSIDLVREEHGLAPLEEHSLEHVND